VGGGGDKAGHRTKVRGRIRKTNPGNDHVLHSPIDIQGNLTEIRFGEGLRI